MFGAGLYTLMDRLPVPCADVIAWSRWWRAADRKVDGTDCGPHYVSTIFLGVVHGWDDEGLPLLFETMVFQGTNMGGIEQWRCATWAQAEEQHARAVDIYTRRANMGVVS